MIMQEREDLAKEETFYFLLEQLVAAGISKTSIEVKAPPVRRVTEHLLGHYTEKVTLEELAAVACMNKYSLLRLFTKTEGITPYRYLETIRIGKAKELLAQDLEPAEVALMTGFSDQSHFSKFFKEVIKSHLAVLIWCGKRDKHFSNHKGKEVRLMKPSDFQKTVQCRFESCLKKVVRSVVKDYYKELNRRKNTVK